MPKALDLRILVEKTWEVTLLDGTIINVKKPTKKIQLLMEQMKDEITIEQQVNLTKDATIAILNNNQEDFQVKHLPGEYDLSIQLAILRGYSEWLTELLTDPN